MGLAKIAVEILYIQSVLKDLGHEFEHDLELALEYFKFCGDEQILKEVRTTAIRRVRRFNVLPNGVL